MKLYIINFKTRVIAQFAPPGGVEPKARRAAPSKALGGGWEDKTKAREVTALSASRSMSNYECVTRQAERAYEFLSISDGILAIDGMSRTRVKQDRQNMNMK